MKSPYFANANTNEDKLRSVRASSRVSDSIRPKKNNKNLPMKSPLTTLQTNTNED